jgi:signal transduction histidine kinase
MIAGKALLREEYSLILSIIAPISFAIAIIRYRVFDINLLFKRSTVYGIVLAALLLLYSGIVASMNFIARTYNFSSSIPDILGALLIALLFEPLRLQVQKIVDKKFFRVSYNFYEAQRGFLDEIKFASNEMRLAESVTKRTDAILSVKRIAFFKLEPSSERMNLIAHQGFGFLERRGIRLQKEELKTGLELPVALHEKIEPGIQYEPADPTVFKRWGIALVLPMLSEERKVLGFLVLGEKRSGAKFTIEDISLLNLVSVQTGLALGRIGIEHKLILEQEESERLSELNTLKSYFVSSVSHDLKTPLTSIRMFAEIMKEQENLPRQKAREYLEIIEGEADRLSRLIANVLDFAKIEKGTKEYSFMPVDLNILAKDVIHSLEYQIHSQGFTKNIFLNQEPLIVKADRDAIFDAVTNLITNAMKYSPPERRLITIRSGQKSDCVALSVQDEGYGIAQNEKEHIFESFYRSGDPQMKSAGGAGLGLSLVKHTMDAHRGKIEVISEVGKGSIFVLYFPINSHEENSDR